jgi:Na+/melibiose symporter-like transporter
MLQAIDPIADAKITHGQLTAYTALLVVAGAITLLLAASGFGQRWGGEQALTGIVGSAFIGYGVYLFLFFDGTGTVWIFWYAFALPVVLIALAIRRRLTRAS